MSHRADLLVIDDEPVLLGAVRKVSQPEGLMMDEASTAGRGLELLSAGTYRLVLTDLMLPGEGGIQILNAMRQDHPRVPVVVITGFATPERAADCFRQGAFDVLPKPFDVSELLAVVRRGLGFSALSETQQRPLTSTEFAVTQQTAVRTAVELFSLGRHAWVSLEPDGSAKIGIGESFRPIGDQIRTLRLPAVDSDTIQGDVCARITTADGLEHRVWSPLSGRVLGTNPACALEMPHTESLSDEWLLVTAPTDLENELELLTRR